MRNLPAFLAGLLLLLPQLAWGQAAPTGSPSLNQAIAARALSSADAAAWVNLSRVEGFRR